jgi:hypothetical protein
MTTVQGISVMVILSEAKDPQPRGYGFFADAPMKINRA